MEDNPESEKKRAPAESPGPQPFLEDSDGSPGRDDDSSPAPKRRRVDESLDGVHSGGSRIGSPEAKRIEDDLLNILDDSDGGSDRDPVVLDLDSVIKSFEEEIVVPDQPAAVLDLTGEETQNELGYLLEASDDELGLPPSFANSGDENSNADNSELPDISSSGYAMPFDGEMPNYDSFDLGSEIGNINGREGNEEFVMLDGLFDLPENCDVADVMWRPESLPAI